MSKTLAHVSIEAVKEGHIEVNKYWLLKDGQVGLDTVREHLPTSEQFLPEEVNNCLTPVASRLVGLSECPSEVRTMFAEVLARRNKKTPGPMKPKQLPEPSRKPTSVRLAQIMTFR